MMQKFDLDSWERKSQYHFFKNYEDPFFNITANVDITTLYQECKQENQSFFLASLHLMTKASNAVKEFRIRQLGAELVIYDQIHPGSTILHEDKSFSFCYFEYMDDLNQFILAGEAEIKAHKAAPNFDPKDERLDLIHCSTVPWISFTSIKHARTRNLTDTIPKIVLGKFFKQQNKILIPISVEVNHSIMDGYHVGCFFEELVSNQHKKTIL